MEIITNMFTIDFMGRWLHIFFGIIWIGILYYFNFVQTPFFAETDASTKNGAIQKLVPRALWWFRWAAKLTFLTGLALFWAKYWPSMSDGGFLFSASAMTISLGALMGIIMYLNVWCIIWPNQKIVIASTTAVANGGQANPAAAAAGARAGVASRTNALFSIPMLFFMVASAHYPIHGVQESSAVRPVFYLIVLLILVIEANAIKGKLVGPLKTVKGVITAGFVLLALFYGLLVTVSSL